MCNTDRPGLSWDENGEPIATQFDDRYFCKKNGIDESTYVFLAQNNLAERWQELTQKHFIIGETGFGTGLNFLLTWRLWLEYAPQDATLHFLSVEKYPLNYKEILQASKLWPELEALANTLATHYPPITNRQSDDNSPVEFRQLSFSDNRVKLTLILGEATTGFRALLPIENPGSNVASLNCGLDITSQFKIDAWFLDGFAPSKNPGMWSDTLFSTLSKLSDENTTFATFTAAGAVRRGLQKVCFHVEKAPGFGHKREMLKGRFQTFTAHEENEEPRNVPKPDPSWHLKIIDTKGNPQDEEIIIIGAGMAGAHTANALAKRGQKVKVLERHRIAHGASGNPQGIVFSKLSHDDDVFARFNLVANHFASQFYAEPFNSNQESYYSSCGAQTGLIQLALTEKQAQQYQQIVEDFYHSNHFVRWVSATEASSLANVNLNHPGLFFPQSGWLSPGELCRKLLAHPNIQVLELHDVQALNPAASSSNASEKSWEVNCIVNNEQDKVFYADKVILTNASDCKSLPQTQHLTVKAIRGQTSSLTTDGPHSPLSCVLCGDGYIAPSNGQLQTTGATFTLKNNNPMVCEEDHLLNLEMTKQLSPTFNDLSLAHVVDGRTSFRCTTPDYLPLVGPVADEQAFTSRFEKYRKNLKAKIDQPGVFHKNLYVNLGHGSKGLCYTPICAALLTDLICGTPLPLPTQLYLHLHPARFLVRDLARNRI